MNKKITVIIIVIILIIGGGLIYLMAGKADNTAKQDMVAQQQTTNQTETNQAAISDKPGTYVNYSQSIIANTTGTKLLFFHAAWCPQCRDLEADIKEKGVPSGVTIIKVDYDTNQPLRQKYGVTLQTTIIRLDDSGNLIKKFVAYDDPSLEAVKKSLL